MTVVMARNIKLQLDILVSEWREKKKKEERPPSESNYSHSSARSVKNSAFSIKRKEND